MAKHMGMAKGHPEEHLHKDTAAAAHHDKGHHGAHHEQREMRGRGMHHEGARGAPHEDRAGGNYGRSEGMRTDSTPWASGRDAAYIKPKFIPDYELLPRDDSGGPEWDPYTAEFGDGGYVTGDKAHLSAHGGRDDPEDADEISSMPHNKAAHDPMRSGQTARNGRSAPRSSVRYSKE